MLSLSADIQNSDLGLGPRSKESLPLDLVLGHLGPISQVKRISVWSSLAQPLKIPMGLWNQHLITRMFLCLFLLSVAWELFGFFCLFFFFYG